MDRLFDAFFALMCCFGSVLAMSSIRYMYLCLREPATLSPPTGAPAYSVNEDSFISDSEFFTAVMNRLHFPFLVTLCEAVYCAVVASVSSRVHPRDDVSGRGAGRVSGTDVYAIFPFIYLHHEQGRVTDPRRRRILLAAKISMTTLLAAVLWTAASVPPQHYANIQEDWRWARDPTLPGWLAICCV